MALPRRLTVLRLHTHIYLRPIQPFASRSYATETLTIPNPFSSAHTLETKPASAVDVVSASATISPKEQRYAVTRTGFRNLPVYLQTSGGGTHLSTVIRRVEGDSQALRDDIIADKTLLATLSVDPSDVKVNPVTRHVVVKVGCSWHILSLQQRSVPSANTSNYVGLARQEAPTLATNKRLLGHVSVHLYLMMNLRRKLYTH
jgi:hypothetical protein